MATYFFHGECMTEEAITSFPSEHIDYTEPGLIISYDGTPYITPENESFGLLHWPYSVYEGSFDTLRVQDESGMFLPVCSEPLVSDTSLIFDLLAIGLLFFAFAAGFSKGGQR